MPKNRNKFKIAAIEAKKEDALNPKNSFDIKDPTPRDAVAQIMRTYQVLKKLGNKENRICS